MKVPICNWFSKWLVALACASIYLHLHGLLKVTPFLFVESIELYDIDRKQASFPYVLRSIFTTLTGPFIGYLGCKFRFDRLVMIGSLLLSIGIAGCFYAKDILTFTLLWGVLFGIGVGVSGNLLTAVLSCHYKNNTTFSYGILSAGASLGGIIYSPLCEFIIEKYKLAGTFLILSALALHTVPASMLLTDSRYTEKRDARKKEFGNKSIQRNECESRNLEQNIVTDHSVSCREKDSDAKSSTSCSDFPQISKSLSRETPYCYEETAAQSNCEFSTRNGIQEFSSQKNIRQLAISLNESSENDNMHESEHINMDEDSERNRTVKNVPDSTLEPDEYPSAIKNSFPAEICKQKQKWNVFQIFHDPVFLLISFTQSSFIGLTTMTNTILADYVIDRGFTNRESALILICSSVADLCGRLSLGWVTERGFMSVSNFSALLYFCYGSCLSAFALVSGVFGLVFFYSLSGFILGGQMTILPSIVSQNFDDDKKTMALSSRYIMLIPISFTISPIIGYFRENLGSYVGLYISTNVFCALCTVLLLFLPSIVKYKIKRAHSKKSVSQNLQLTD